MHSAPAQTDQSETRFARFGHSHGYRLEGDSALLNAHIDVSPNALNAASSLALQLWACEEPYRGGPLSGFKVAEAPIALSELDALTRLDAVAFARPPTASLSRPLASDLPSLPAEPRDYSMVLVLASGSDGSFEQVLDFANYPARQRFAVPHLAGSAGYKLHDDGSVSLHVERVINPRGEDNLSGTLALQLWASEKPYAGGELHGSLLASHELGQLRGHDSLAPEELHSLLTRSANGAPHLVLALCEWTALGYLVRDYGNFDAPYRAAVSNPLEALAGPEPEAAQAALPTPAATAVEARASAREQNSVAPAVLRPSLNTIGEADLARLAGISKKLAGQVIKARPFKSVDDLRHVRGIGDKTVDRLRKLLTT